MTESTEPRMPTTVPSPVDRGQFRFVAVDASGRVWRWNDDDLVWECQEGGPDAEGGQLAGGTVVH